VSESLQAIDFAVQILADLPALCQPVNQLLLLPSVLALLTGLVKLEESSLTPTVLKVRSSGP
jgi:hypothetical protein